MLVDVDLSGVDSAINDVGTAIGEIDLSKTTDVGMLACCIGGVALGLGRFFGALSIYIAWGVCHGYPEKRLQSYIGLALVVLVAIILKWFYLRVSKWKKVTAPAEAQEAPKV